MLQYTEARRRYARRVTPGAVVATVMAFVATLPFVLGAALGVWGLIAGYLTAFGRPDTPPGAGEIWFLATRIVAPAFVILAVTGSVFADRLIPALTSAHRADGDNDQERRIKATAQTLAVAGNVKTPLVYVIDANWVNVAALGNRRDRAVILTTSAAGRLSESDREVLLAIGMTDALLGGKAARILLAARAPGVVLLAATRRLWPVLGLIFGGQWVALSLTNRAFSLGDVLNRMLIVVVFLPIILLLPVLYGVASQQARTDAHANADIAALSLLRLPEQWRDAMIRFASQLDQPSDLATFTTDWLIPLEAESFQRRFDQLGEAVPAAAFSLAGQAIPDDVGVTADERAMHARRQSFRARVYSANEQRSGPAADPTSVFRLLAAELRQDAFGWQVGVVFALFGLFLACVFLSSSVLTGFAGYQVLVQPDQPTTSLADPNAGLDGALFLGATVILVGFMTFSALSLATTHRLLPRLLGGRPLALHQPTSPAEQRVAAVTNWATEATGCQPRIWLVDDPVADAAQVGHGPPDRPSVLVTTGAANLPENGLATLLTTAIGHSVTGFRTPTLLRTAALPLAVWFRWWRPLIGLWLLALAAPVGIGSLQGRSDIDRLAEGFAPGLLFAGLGFGVLAVLYSIVEPVPRSFLHHADLGAIIAMGGLAPWLHGRGQLRRPTAQPPKAKLPLWVLPGSHGEHRDRIEALAAYLPEAGADLRSLAWQPCEPPRAENAERRRPRLKGRHAADAPPPGHRRQPGQM